LKAKWKKRRVRSKKKKVKHKKKGEGEQQSDSNEEEKINKDLKTVYRHFHQPQPKNNRNLINYHLPSAVPKESSNRYEIDQQQSNNNEQREVANPNDGMTRSKIKIRKELDSKGDPKYSISSNIKLRKQLKKAPVPNPANPAKKKAIKAFMEDK
jgi:hypothetical protein